MNKKLLRKLGFNKEIDAVECGFCQLCKNPISIDEFKDELSKKEYKISGICQKCQNKVFENEKE